MDKFTVGLGAVFLVLGALEWAITVSFFFPSRLLLQASWFLSVVATGLGVSFMTAGLIKDRVGLKFW